VTSFKHLGPVAPTRVKINPMLIIGFLYIPEFPLAQISHMLIITQGYDLTIVGATGPYNYNCRAEIKNHMSPFLLKIRDFLKIVAKMFYTLIFLKTRNLDSFGF